MTLKKGKSLPILRILVWVLSVAVASGCTYVAVHYIQSRSSVIPTSVMDHVAFQLYTPSPTNDTWLIPKSSVSFNSQQGVVSLTAISKNNSLALSEQQTPSVFSDIPNYYDLLLGKMNLYGEVQSSFGMVELTHPKELGGVQTAVLNTNGTLMFVRPTHNLSQDQWLNFFNNLIITK